MTIQDIRDLCVTNFPLSTTRPSIMVGLENVINELTTNNITGEVWIDGSFVTHKIDPDDVDIVLKTPGDFIDNATASQQTVVEWLNSDLKISYHCDSYVFMVWPEDHPNYWIGEYLYGYWMRQFGFSRGNEMKGIPVVIL